MCANRCVLCRLASPCLLVLSSVSIQHAHPPPLPPTYPTSRYVDAQYRVQRGLMKNQFRSRTSTDPIRCSGKRAAPRAQPASPTHSLCTLPHRPQTNIPRVCRVRAAFPPRPAIICNQQAISRHCHAGTADGRGQSGPALLSAPQWPQKGSNTTVGPTSCVVKTLTGPASMIVRVAYTNVGEQKEKATYQASRLDCLRATKRYYPRREPRSSPHARTLSLCLSVYLSDPFPSFFSFLLYSRTPVCLSASTSMGLARPNPSPPTL